MQRNACYVFLRNGDVPLECLFECQHPDTCKAREDTSSHSEGMSGPKCKRCGSTEVRWRMQGGKWVLFSLQPGVLHKCANPSASEDFK